MSSSAELLKALATIAAAGADISLLKDDSVAVDIVAKVQEVLSQFPVSQHMDSKGHEISSNVHVPASTAAVHATTSAEACSQSHISTQSDNGHGNVVDVRLHVSGTLLPTVNVSIACLPLACSNTNSHVHDPSVRDLNERVSLPAPEPQAIASCASSVKPATPPLATLMHAGSESSLTSSITRIPALPPLSAAQLALPHGHPSAHRADALAFLAHRQPSPLDAAVLPVFARTLAQSDRALAALALGRSAAVSHISLREQELAAPVRQRLVAATASLARLTVLAGGSDAGDDSGGVEDEAEKASAREQLSTCRARVAALTDELRGIEAAAAAVRTQASQEHQRSVQAYTRSTAQQLREVWACAQLQPNTLRGAVVTLHMPERQCARQRATAAQWAASQRARQTRAREQREQRDAQAAGRHALSTGHLSTAEDGTRARDNHADAEGAVMEGVDASVRVRCLPSGACEADVLALVTLPVTAAAQLDARAASPPLGRTQTHPSTSPTAHSTAAATADVSTPSSAAAPVSAATSASTSTSASLSSSSTSSSTRYPAVFPAMAHLAFSHSPAQPLARDGSHSGRRAGAPPRTQEPIEGPAYSYNSVCSAASPPARARGDPTATSADALPSASVLTSLPALQQYLARAVTRQPHDAHALRRSPSPSSSSSTISQASLAALPRPASSPSPVLRLTLPLTLPPPRLPLSVPLAVALLPHFTASPALAEATGTIAPRMPFSSPATASPPSLSSQAARIALSSVTSRLLHSTSAPLALYSPPMFLARARQAPPTHLTWEAHNVNKEDAALLAAKAAQACGLSLVNPLNEANVTSLPPHSALCPVPAALRVPATATLADIAAQVPSLLRHTRPSAAAPAGEFDGDECVVDLEGDAARYSMRSLRSYVARKLGDADNDARGRALTTGSSTTKTSAVPPRTRTRSRGHHRSVRDVMLRAARQGPHCADWELLEWGAGASLEVRFVPEEWVQGVGEDTTGTEAGAGAGAEEEVRMHDGGSWAPEAHALIEAQWDISAGEDAQDAGVRVQLRAADAPVEDAQDAPAAEPLQAPGPVPVYTPVALQHTHAALGLALPTMTPNDADALHTTTGPLPSHARFAAGPVDATAVPLVVEVPPAVPSAPLAAQALCAVVQQAQLLADQRARSEALDSPLQATFAEATASSAALLSVSTPGVALPVAVTVRTESQPTATVRLPLSHLREWQGTPCVSDFDRLEASALIAAAAARHVQSCAAHAPHASVRPCSPLCASLLRARTIDARAPDVSAHAHGPALAAWLRVVSAELLPAPSASTPLLSLRPSTLRADVAVRAWMQRRFAEKAVATAPGVVAPGPHAQCACGAPTGVCACELLVDADLHTLASLPLTLPLAFDVSIRGPVRLRGDGTLRCYEHHTHRALLCKLLQADEDVSIDEEDDERADADADVSPREERADADARTPSAARHSHGHGHDECVPSMDVYRVKDEREVRARLCTLMFGWRDISVSASGDTAEAVSVASRVPPLRAAVEVVSEPADAPEPEATLADPTGTSDAVEGADFLLPQTHAPRSNTEDTAAAARSLAGDENFSPLSSPLRGARTVADTVAHTVTDLRNTATSLLGGALAAGRHIGVSFWRGRRPEQDSDVPPHPSRTSLLKPAATMPDAEVSSSPRPSTHNVPSPRLSAPPAYSLPALLAITPMPTPAPRTASRKDSRAGADASEGVGVRVRSRKAKTAPPLSASALQSLLLHKPPSAPPASFLDQQVSFANAARTSRLYEQYFVLCLTCRLPSLCPPCGMRCHRGHRLLSWSALTAAREHVKAATALAELQRAGVVRVPRQWLWPDAIDTTPAPASSPALSPLALALLLLLQIARALPAIMGSRLLRTACPALSAQARARALLVPRWALYSEWHDGVLFHDTGIVQRRSTDGGEEMSRHAYADVVGTKVVEEEVKFRRCVCDAACGWPNALQPWDVYGSPAAQTDEHDEDEDEDEDAAAWRMVQHLRRRRCLMGPYAGLTADPIVSYAVEGQWPERSARAYARASAAVEAACERGAIAVVADGPPPLTSPQRLSPPAHTARSPPTQLAIAAPMSASGRPQHHHSPAASPPIITPSQPSLVSSIPPGPALSFYASMGYSTPQPSHTAVVPPTPSTSPSVPATAPTSVGTQPGMQPSTYSLAQQAQPASSTFARVRMQQQRASAVLPAVAPSAPGPLPPLVNAHEFDDLDSILRAPMRPAAASGIANSAHVPAQSPPPAYSAPPTHTHTHHHHHHHAPRADLEATRARYWRCVIALEDMGFPVDDAVLRLIDRCEGNADAVVDVLLRSDTHR